MSAMPPTAAEKRTSWDFRIAPWDLYGLIGVKASNHHLLVRRIAIISSSRPNCRQAAARSDSQGWPKAIAKRLVLDGREHSGRLCRFGTMVILPGVFLSLWCDNYDDAEGSPPSGASVAPHTCIRSVAEDRNHDAVMRIGGEAPRRWAHSKPRLEGHSPIPGCRHLGPSSAAQLTGTADSPRCLPTGTSQAARRRSRPAGASPVVTSFQNAMRSLRASATIMVLRVPLRASAVRLRYQSASELFF